MVHVVMIMLLSVVQDRNCILRIKSYDDVYQVERISLHVVFICQMSENLFVVLVFELLQHWFHFLFRWVMCIRF